MFASKYSQSNLWKTSTEVIPSEGDSRHLHSRIVRRPTPAVEEDEEFYHVSRNTLSDPRMSADLSRYDNLMRVVMHL